MSQWEREYALYHKIANIKFFKLYKLWKQFSVLKNYIRSKKRTDASESLKEKLFIFSPPLRSALLKVKRLSLKLAEDHQIISLERAIQSNVFNLDEFILIQQQVHDKLRIELDNLSAIVLNSVRGGCDEVVDMFLKANNIAANHKMTFMERAALRAECKRLTRFLRMVDLIMNDFLLGIVTTGVTMLGQALRTSEEIIPIIERDAAADMTTIVANRKESESTTPLFRVVVNFKKKQAGEMWEDSLIIRPTLDQLTKRIYSIIASSLDVVNKFVKVYQAHETEIYVMPEGDEDAGVSNDSEKADLATVIRGNVRFSEASDLIFANLRHSYAAVREYVHVFDSYRQLYFNNQVYVNDISSTFAEGTIQTFLDSISHYRKMVTSFKDIPKYADVGALFVDSAEMKGQLTPSPNLCIDALKAWIPQLAIKRAQELLDEVGYMNPIISSEPATVEAYVNKKKTKDTANENLELYKDKQDYVRALVNLLDENTWEVPDSLKALIRMLKESIISLETNIQTADGREEDETKRFSLQVAEECPKLLKKIAECREQLDAAIVGDPDTPDEKVIKYLSQIEIDFLKLRARVEKVQDYQGILRLPVDDFDVLNEVQSDLSLKTRLWTDKAEWSKLRDRLMDTQIADLDVSILEKELARYNKTLFLASKGLPTSKVVPRLKSSVEELNPVLPVVIDLRNPALKDRHWDKIYDLIKVDIKNETDFSLTDLINEGVTKYQEDISIIATAALQESILEEMMLKVTTIWEKLEFEVKPYKDVKDLYILGDVTEVTSALDDSLVTVNTVLGSRYVAGLVDYDAKSRDEWIFLHPGQVVATVAQMTWARGTESSLRAKDSTKRMIAWFNECKNELQKLIVKIRGSLSKLHRSIIVALVTTDVHARDIIDELVQRKVDSIQDFVWQQQLRYYWESSVNDYGELQVVLEEELAAVGLQKVPSFMTKVIQLFDIFNIRFGATLVGYAGTGKTTCYKILASVMTTLREKRKSSNPEFQKVRIKVLNPKSISMGDLYGEFNPLTQEWHDGLASSIMREFVLEEDNDDRRWTVFDGPIDALWIENLNTVLDDNMTLCLANGQRIKLKNEMKCLFEVNDLAAASPATVSRIGVVYMSSTDLGYMPYVQSWISGSLTIGLQTAGLTSTLLNFIRERVTVLFKSVFIKGLQIQRKQCKEPIETVDIQQAISLCTLLESLMIDSIPKAIAAANNQTANNNRQDIVLCLIDRLFFFVFVWSVGASISYEEWELFSDSTREIFDEVSPSLQLPPSGLVFDYFVDYSALSNINNINISSNDVKFKEWSDVVPSFEFKDNVPYFNLMVPTVDTVRYFFVMQRLIESNKPCFVTGITGTGKTVAVQNLLKSLNPTTTPNSKLFAKPIVFIDFLKPEADPRFYEEVKELPRLTAVLNDLLDQYNVTFPSQMNLVFFQDALTHTARISRVLRQPRG
eukprot:gene17367-22915_t